MKSKFGSHIIKKSKKYFPVLLIIFFFVIFPGSLYSENQFFLSNQIIDQILKKTKDPVYLNDDLIKLTSLAAKDLNQKDTKIDTIQKTISRLAENIRLKIAATMEPEKIIEILNQNIFKEGNFKIDHSKLFESSLETVLLSKVFMRKKGQCLSLSLIYLMVAEKLDLPIYGVMIPKHFFVRYENREERFQIETTAKGRLFDVKDYQTNRLDPYSRRFLDQNLTKKQVLAVYLEALATQYKLAGHHQKAIEIFEAILPHLPGRPSLLVNLGNAYERDKNILKALMHYQKALEINPYLCEAHYNLGLLHFLYTNKKEEAKHHGMIARKLGCQMHPSFRAFMNN